MKIDNRNYGNKISLKNNKNKFYIETYGCQMNISDSEIVISILLNNGFEYTSNLYKANIIFINTCSIRKKAEETVNNRLIFLNFLKKKNPNIIIGILGCMASNMKYKILENSRIVDLISGPDSYRDLPQLIKSVKNGKEAVNVILSSYETYADINPVRVSGNKVTAFVTITRGCDNMCTFCVVPFTRGRERSRCPDSILKECSNLYKNGYKEVILLGQNVDSYFWYGGGAKKDFHKYIKNNDKVFVVKFYQLLELIAVALPKIRIRFSTSNPHDMSCEVLKVINNHPNICKSIHLPVQSGSNSILKKMNRKYTREQYISLIDNIRNIIPNCSISYDIITGFCGETDKDHKDTLSLMDYVKYEFGYMFSYSSRKNTFAYRKYVDDVPELIKKKRLQDVIDLQRIHSYYRMKKYLGNIEEVLIEKTSKKNNDYSYGRNSQNIGIVFPKKKCYNVGDLVNVKINSCTSATLIGEIVI